MKRICGQCGKTVEGEGMAFCPFCGTKLEPAVPEKATASGEAETAGTAAPREEALKWVQKAAAVSSYPEKRKILDQGLAACPDSPEILWERLFIGEESKKKSRKSIDFSIIQCWALEIYRKPGDFSEEERARLRGRLFDLPELRRYQSLVPDPEKGQRDYLLRLCRDYIEIFLEGSNQVMGSLFGFRLERNREKRLAAPVAEMMERVDADTRLTAPQRELLRQSLYQAFDQTSNGKREYLDALLGAGGR